jgi:hypothetical protein
MALSKVLTEAIAFVPQGYLFGLTMSTAGASASLTVAAGMAVDSTGTRTMRLAGGLTKTTAAWAAGSGVGGLDTGTIANNTWYHWFEIMNPTTGTVDVVFSATATPANGPTTLPAGFTFFRRIGSWKTNGSAQWSLIFQFEDKFLWDSAIIPLDLSLITATTTSAASATLSVPTGIRVTPILSVLWGGPSDDLRLSPLDLTDQAAINSNASQRTAGLSVIMQGYDLWTNTSGQIRYRVDTASQTLQISTFGWVDSRGKIG